MDIRTETTELYPKLYWVGVYDRDSGLQCNPYLIIDGEEAVLIDPGSTLDFELVYSNVIKLIPLEKIRYVVLQHQDPDLCSSMPLFEAKGLRAKIVTHWRAATLIRYYGVKSEFYIVNEHEYKLTFGNQRVLYFHPTPYLHFPGAIVTYDVMSKVLFSSDLFGAFTENWSLFADCVDGYCEAMKTFHEHYMPGNEVLRPVVERLAALDLSMIAPQHGSIIRFELMKYINTLRELECGIFLNPVKKELRKIDGFTGLCNLILKRYYSTFSKDEVKELFTESHIKLDEEGLISDYNCTGRELWQSLFELIYSHKGVRWLSFIEPYVFKLVSEYEIETPSVYSGSLLAFEKERTSLDEENKRLSELNRQLELNLEQTYDNLLRCPITKLRNEIVFKEYLRNFCASDQSVGNGGAILFIAIDAMAKINEIYGKAHGDEVIKAVAYELETVKEDAHSLFKLEGPAFAYHIAGVSRNKSLDVAATIRSRIEKSEAVLRPITVSIGFVAIDERPEAIIESGEAHADYLIKVAKIRETIARKRGGNMVCSASSADADDLNTLGKVLIVDTDEVNLEVLRVAFERLNYSVLTSKDGTSALQMILAEKPGAVVCEAMMPQLDGFTLCEKLREFLPEDESSFILLSHQKDVESITRAFACDVSHFFQKPYFLSEVTGVVGQHFRRR